MLIKTPADIGRIIRGARIVEGLSQSQLAAKFGTTQSWISEIENGKATAELGMVLKVMSFLQIEVDLTPPGLLPPPGAHWPDDELDIDGIAEGGPKP